MKIGRFFKDISTGFGRLLGTTPPAQNKTQETRRDEDRDQLIIDIGPRTGRIFVAKGTTFVEAQALEVEGLGRNTQVVDKALRAALTARLGELLSTQPKQFFSQSFAGPYDTGTSPGFELPPDASALFSRRCQGVMNTVHAFDLELEGRRYFVFASHEGMMGGCTVDVLDAKGQRLDGGVMKNGEPGEKTISWGWDPAKEEARRKAEQEAAQEAARRAEAARPKQAAPDILARQLKASRDGVLVNTNAMWSVASASEPKSPRELTRQVSPHILQEVVKEHHALLLMHGPCSLSDTRVAILLPKDHEIYSARGADVKLVVPPEGVKFDDIVSTLAKTQSKRLGEDGAVIVVAEKARGHYPPESYRNMIQSELQRGNYAPMLGLSPNYNRWAVTEISDNPRTWISTLTRPTPEPKAPLAPPRQASADELAAQLSGNNDRVLMTSGNRTVAVSTSSEAAQIKQGGLNHPQLPIAQQVLRHDRAVLMFPAAVQGEWRPLAAAFPKGHLLWQMRPQSPVTIAIPPKDVPFEDVVAALSRSQSKKLTNCDRVILVLKDKDGDTRNPESLSRIQNDLRARLTQAIGTSTDQAQWSAVELSDDRRSWVRSLTEAPAAAVAPEVTTPAPEAVAETPRATQQQRPEGEKVVSLAQSRAQWSRDEGDAIAARWKSIRDAKEDIGKQVARLDPKSPKARTVITFLSRLPTTGSATDLKEAEGRVETLRGILNSGERTMKGGSESEKKDLPSRSRGPDMGGSYYRPRPWLGETAGKAKTQFKSWPENLEAVKVLEKAAKRLPQAESALKELAHTRPEVFEGKDSITGKNFADHILAFVEAGHADEQAHGFAAFIQRVAQRVFTTHIGGLSHVHGIAKGLVMTHPGLVLALVEAARENRVYKTHGAYEGDGHRSIPPTGEMAHAFRAQGDRRTVPYEKALMDAMVWHLAPKHHEAHPDLCNGRCAPAAIGYAKLTGRPFRYSYAKKIQTGEDIKKILAAVGDQGLSMPDVYLQAKEISGKMHFPHFSDYDPKTNTVQLDCFFMDSRRISVDGLRLHDVAIYHEPNPVFEEYLTGGERKVGQVEPRQRYRFTEPLPPNY